MNSPVCILDPSAVAVNRVQLDINNGPIRITETGINWGDSAVTAYQSSEQRWGSTPVSYRVPNRVITIPFTLLESSLGAMETARSQIAEKVALFQREGGWILRQRATGGGPLYADVVNATLTMPDVTGEILGAEQGGVLTLECLPDMYGDLITLDTLTGSGEVCGVLQQSGRQAIILGDHPGRAQITVFDTSGNQQFGMLWAFRSRHYSSQAPVVINADAVMTPAAGASVSALAGARGATAITQPSVTSTWTDMAYLTGSHIGSYQVWTRVYSATAGVSYRIGWQVGDRLHGLILNPQSTVALGNGFYLQNLGQIRLDPTSIGVQQWQAAIQALSPGGTISASLDMVYLQPLDEAAGLLEGSTAAPANPVCIASGRTQLRFDSVTRTITGGTVFTPVLPIGDLPRIPPSGAHTDLRPVEVFVKPSRGDLQSVADSASQDTLTVIVAYRPTWIGRP